MRANAPKNYCKKGSFFMAFNFTIPIIQDSKAKFKYLGMFTFIFNLCSIYSSILTLTFFFFKRILSNFSTT